MKRQSEELFFKYISSASQQGNNCVIFHMPDEYEPLQGDIIEMIISEPDTYGGATYYAKIILYKDGDDIYTAALDGRLKGNDGSIYTLYTASYNINAGNKLLYLFANDNANIAFNEQGNLVNMIVHRPKAGIELYVA